MARQILPEEILHNSIEVHEFRNRTKSKVIYLILLLIIICSLICSFFFKVKIYSSARGQIIPDKDRTNITSIKSGRILFSSIKDNSYVRKGDTLLIIDDNITFQIQFEDSQLKRFKNEIEDLQRLLNTKDYAVVELITSKYRHQLISFNEKLSELKIRYADSEIDFQRNKKLYNKGIISKSDFENITMQYEIANSQITQHIQQQVNLWEVALIETQNEFKSSELNKAEIKKHNRNSIIVAPVDGTLINIKGIEVNSYVSAGSVLAEISPNSNLIVECYMKPSDIGLLRPQNKVNYLIDAFNYNQWGVVEGEIVEIGNDVEVKNNTPYFMVKCSLKKNYLLLENKFKGNLKKGMTLTARFQVAERTVFQLFYDKVDDWVNPSLEN